MLALPPLGFGGAPIGGLLDPVDDAAAVATLRSALEGGIRYFDTAPFYGFGLSERRVGDGGGGDAARKRLTTRKVILNAPLEETELTGR